MERPKEFFLPGLEDSLRDDSLEAFKSQVGKVLGRESYFRDMWDEISAQEVKT